MNKRLYLVIPFVLFAGCIEPFEPEIGESDHVMVIFGELTGEEGIHSVQVSTSTPYNDPSYEPVAGCIVRVEDQDGQGFYYSESSPGEYTAFLEQEFLVTGNSYRLIVFTPGGEEYQSEYDTLLSCAEIDSLYFREEKHSSANNLTDIYGLQILADVKGGINDSRNYLWTLNETWEYKSSYYTMYIWDGHTLEEYLPFIHEWMICYLTLDIKERITGSSRLNASNEITGQPLNFVSNQSDRLRRGYSLLVSQHSLTEQAYLFWENLTAQVEESGGLYEHQPAVAPGNICNVNDAGEKVLGLFYASEVKEKRININQYFDFPIASYYCPADTVNSIYDLTDYFPYYMFSISDFGRGPPFVFGPRECHDCRLRGGITTKPDFWMY